MTLELPARLEGGRMKNNKKTRSCELSTPRGVKVGVAVDLQLCHDASRAASLFQRV